MLRTIKFATAGLALATVFVGAPALANEVALESSAASVATSQSSILASSILAAISSAGVSASSAQLEASIAGAIPQGVSASSLSSAMNVVAAEHANNPAVLSALSAAMVQLGGGPVPPNVLCPAGVFAPPCLIPALVGGAVVAGGVVVAVEDDDYS